MASKLPFSNCCASASSRDVIFAGGRLLNVQSPFRSENERLVPVAVNTAAQIEGALREHDVEVLHRARGQIER